MREREERVYSALCHLVNTIPVWGLLICGFVVMRLREESRRVVSHARQAMVFHAIMLGVLVVYFVIGLLAKIIWVISPVVSQWISWLNLGIVAALAGGYVLICLWGTYCCLQGRRFRYPLVRFSN